MTPNDKYAEVHPKVSEVTGRYPLQFKRPLSVMEILEFNILELDHMLEEYNLPLNASRYTGYGAARWQDTYWSSLALRRQRISSPAYPFAREAQSQKLEKLMILFEYLGLDTSNEHVRNRTILGRRRRLED